MGPDVYLGHLRRDLDAFGACLAGDLAAPIEHCGDWTLRKLAGHLGRGNLWTVQAVTERRGDLERIPVPADQDELRHWFTDTAEKLLAALDADPEQDAWTFAPPHTVGFWQRRRAQETLVHRWDAQHALGEPGPIDAELADDGVAEVFDTMAPRQIRIGRMSPPPHAIRLGTTDTGSAWTFGDGDPVATISATAADLLLLLWGRLAADDDALTWQGDRDAGLAVLAEPLTP